MSEIRNIELHVLVGLPGSGKTTFAEEMKKNETGSNRVDIVDFDKVARKLKDVYYKDKDQMENVRNMVFSYSSKNIWILDGLFLTQKDVEWVISVYADSEYFKRYYNISKIIIHYWSEDRESCLWNDKGRRNQNSTMTIKNAEFYKPDIAKIEGRFNIKTEMVEHSVVRKSNIEVITDSVCMPLYDDKYIYSGTWCMGGEQRDCWGSTSKLSVDAPCNFDALDELLEKFCPEITFLQYKKLYNACVTEDSRYNHDYYSSWEEGYYKCDIVKLFEMLEEMGLVDLNTIIENIGKVV